MKINSTVQNIQPNLIKGIDSNDTASKGVSFADYLNSAIDQVNSMQLESEKLNQDFAMGLTDNIPQVLIAAEKAGIALQYTMQIRNKVIDAYQEIMRMPV
jgi:flagellar hook-basal body complex protein FliE